jgi:COP9 signalosome complex subunit 7
MFGATEEKSVASSSNRLEEFLLLAKSAHGAAAVDLIKRVTECPGVYTFGELLATPAIQEVR